MVTGLIIGDVVVLIAFAIALYIVNEKRKRAQAWVDYAFKKTNNLVNYCKKNNLDISCLTEVGEFDFYHYVNVISASKDEEIEG